ncbi:phosphatidate cytidylyltransferase [Pseudorhodoplanes sinuspersici]|nr:phosphatidate cytidylyltransferase [Pseudorhodoplanes sinuspersici]RKE73362.1 phosphatidate cytidylyltransferase [Pseudorhodoplanes sinuspersici]
MPSHDPAMPVSETTSTPSARNLWLRIASAAILAPLAVGAAYLGSWPFSIFWLVAAIAVWWEWVGLVDPAGRHVVLATGACALILQAILIETGHAAIAIMVIALGVLAAVVTAGRQSPLVAGGIVYASALLVAPVILRADEAFGFAAILMLFAVVWGTDIGGYFSGRTFGGPKLAAAISPKKTWSGAIGGTIVGIAAAIAICQLFGIKNVVSIGLIALALSIVSQAGDLFESWLKRRVDAKDASGLIPGHGGVMDRLDGFIFAATVAALLGVVRGGLETPANALLIW